MLMVATDGKAAYINLGGPGIKYINKNWSLSINMLPSLRLMDDAPRPFVTPTLGAGILFSYKRLVIGVPFYYNAPKLKWSVAVGAGIKIGK